MATKKAAKAAEKLPYVIVRDHRSGVHAGYLEHHNQIAKTAILTMVRHIYSWQGRLNTTDIAARGLGEGSKISPPVSRKELNDVIDVSYASDEAHSIIVGLATWKQ